MHMCVYIKQDKDIDMDKVVIIMGDGVGYHGE